MHTSIEPGLADWTIILIHTGNPDYLKYNLSILSSQNPDSTIILAGDETNSRLAALYPNVYWHSINEALEQSSLHRKFRKRYQHFSINRLQYERFCFERWFILLTLANCYNLDQYLYLDSDNFLLTPVASLLSSYRGYDYGQTIRPSAPEFIFFRGTHVLEEFCDYLNKFYGNPRDVIARLVQRSTEKLWGGPHPSGATHHFSDMWALLDFWENTQHTGEHIYFHKTADFKHVVIPQVMQGDRINIHVFSGYEKELFRFNGEQRTASVFHDGKWMQVNMIHFQGDSKDYARDFYLRYLRATQNHQILQCKLVPSLSLKTVLKRLSKLVVSGFGSLSRYKRFIYRLVGR